MKLKLIIPTLLLIFCCTSVFAETEEEKKEKKEKAKKEYEEKVNKAFSDSDSVFISNKVPKKWESESAVILAKSLEYKYEGTSIHAQTRTLRTKIILLDKEAVRNYSEIYYYSGGKYYIRIIKKDGTKKIINLNEDGIAVGGVPFYFSGNSLFINTARKVAISDLEPGDIIEQYSESRRTHSSANAEQFYYAYPMVKIRLPRYYPTVYQRYRFKSENINHLSVRYLNGAPKLELTETKKINRKEKMLTYEVVDTMRPKIERVKWMYDDLIYPTIKFQVVHAARRHAKNISFNYTGKKAGVLSDSLTAKEIEKKLKKQFGHFDAGAYQQAKILVKHVKKRNKRLKDKHLFLEKVYYLYRKRYVINYSNDEDDYIWSRKFAFTMAEVCKRKGWDFEMGVIVPVYKGGMKNVLYSGETRYFIEVDGQRYYQFNGFTPIGEHRELVEGATIYKMKKTAKSKNFSKLKIETFEYTDSEKNYFSTSFGVKFDLKKNQTIVEDTIVNRGHEKYSAIQMLLASDTMWKGDRYLYETPRRRRAKRVRRQNVKRWLEETRYKSSAKLKRDRKLEASRTRSLSDGNGYWFEEYDSIEVVNIGRTQEDSDIEYIEHYKLNGMLRKVQQKDFMFEIGSLLGSQVRLKEEDLKRTVPVFMNNNRVYHYNFTIRIPRGYMVKGEKALEQSINNDLCKYEVKTKVKGNRLFVNVTKEYKKAQLTVEEWSKLVKMLETAYDFTEKKIMFKKL